MGDLMFSEKLKEALVEAISEYVVTQIPSFDIAEHAETSFSRLGLDSLSHVELTAVIEKTLSVELEPDLAFNYPTVTALIQFLSEEYGQQQESAEEAANATA